MDRRQGFEYLQHIVRKQYEKNPDAPKNIRWLKDLKLYELINETPHQFITVALPNSYDLGKLHKQLTTKMHKWLKGSTCVVEYHSATGDNLHLHILRRGNYSKTKIIRDLSRKFKVESNFVDVQRSNKDNDYQNRLKYINGDKVSEEKQVYCINDSIWREMNDLDEYYNL